MTPTVVVTRPHGPYPGAERLIQSVQAAGFPCVHLPVLKITTLPLTALLSESLAHLAEGRFDWVVWLSPTAVCVTHELFMSTAVVGRLPDSVRIAVQGLGTNEAVRACFGRDADFVPDVALAEELAVKFGILLQGEYSDPSEARVLVLQAQEGRNVVAPPLSELGFTVTVHPIYATEASIPSDEERASVPEGALDDCIFLFMSPSAVRATRKALPEEELLRAAAVCVGPITAHAAREVGFTSVFEAYDHSESGLITLLTERFQR